MGHNDHGSNDDAWWIFIATLDRSALIYERPGSPADLATRAQHAARRAAFYGRVDEAEQKRAFEEAAEWAAAESKRRREARIRNRQLREQMAAYAAKRRAERARKVA